MKTALGCMSQVETLGLYDQLCFEETHLESHSRSIAFVLFSVTVKKKVDSPSWSTHFPPTIHREPAHSRKWQTSHFKTRPAFISPNSKRAEAAWYAWQTHLLQWQTLRQKWTVINKQRTNLLEACWSFSSEWSSCRSPPARPFDSAVDLTHSQHKLSANCSKHHVSLSSVFTDHHQMKEWADTRSEAMFLQWNNFNTHSLNHNLHRRHHYHHNRFLSWSYKRCLSSLVLYNSM